VSDLFAQLLFWLARVAANTFQFLNKSAVIVQKYRLKYLFVLAISSCGTLLSRLVGWLDPPFYSVAGNETHYNGLDFAAPPKVRAVVRLVLDLLNTSPYMRVRVEPKDLAIAQAIFAGKSLDSQYLLELFQFFTSGQVTDDSALSCSHDLYLRWYLYGGQVGRNWVNTCVNAMRNYDADVAAGRIKPSEKTTPTT